MLLDRRTLRKGGNRPSRLTKRRFSAAAADKIRLLEELELAQKRETQQLQEELRQRAGDADMRRMRAASDMEIAVEKIRILEAEVRSCVSVIPLIRYDQ